jgi:hypothetical protein
MIAAASRQPVLHTPPMPTHRSPRTTASHRRRALGAIAAVALLASIASIASAPLDAQTPRFDRVFPLDSNEGVFAYARISPDGRYLLYASERHRAGAPPQMETLVDLRDKRVLWEDRGIDGYWSPTGDRFIYEQMGGRMPMVNIRHMDGRLVKDVAPARLGDYFSWGTSDGHDVILTIISNYFPIHGDSAKLPANRVPSCPGIGVGERPLISRDAKHITTFVRGTIVVRSLTDCGDVFDTGIPGAKADFSWDGRYIAFHVLKQGAAGYDIGIVDLKDHTIRRTTLPGSSFFPSWTRDGRLCFRYDGADYKGFLMASNVLSLPGVPLPTQGAHNAEHLTWQNVFPEARRPEARVTVALAWGPWSAHSPEALSGMQRAQVAMDGRGVAFVAASDPQSSGAVVQRLLKSYAPAVRPVPLEPDHLALTNLNNQNPAYLLFRGDSLVGRHLGAMSAEEIEDWVRKSR